MKNFDKQIWTLFKMNMSDYNKAYRKIEKVLEEIFEQGKKTGRKEAFNEMKTYINKNSKS